MLVCVAACQGCADWSKEAVAQSQRRGDKIIAALEAYKADHTTYPKALDELVPQYLSKIEPPTAGSEVWFYETYEGGSVFKLLFKGPTKYHPSCWYLSSSPDWWLDTK
jgi:hypothetical protein